MHPPKRANGSEGQQIETGEALLAITCRDPLRDHVLPILAALSSAGLESLKSSTCLPGNLARVPWELKSWLLLGYFGVQGVYDHQARKGIITLIGTLALSKSDSFAVTQGGRVEILRTQVAL